jgi:hypothetical protein
LASRFAKKCTQHERLTELFPLNENPVHTRKKHKYTVKFAKTQKLYKFAIPAMQRILNNQ